MATSDDNYTNVLLEEMRDQNKAILELVKDVPGIKRRVSNVEERLDKLQDDVTVIKAAVKDQGKQVSEHERKLKGQFRVRRA